MKAIKTYSSLFGLIGYPLSHSFSKKYFTEKFKKEKIEDHAYELFPIKDIEAFRLLIGSYPNLKGLNVTIPYKQQVLPFLDDIDPEAQAVGAVNTIKIKGDQLIGYNTDVYGFEHSLLNVLPTDEEGNRIIPKGALVFGTGGAAKAVSYVLKKMGMEVLKVSRSQGKGALTYKEIDGALLKTHPLLVNTTPLGMSPQIDTCPELPYEELSKRNVLYDLVYNPEKTLFLKKGIMKNCFCKNGLEMLHLQAEKAWEIWNTKTLLEY